LSDSPPSIQQHELGLSREKLHELERQFYAKPEDKHHEPEVCMALQAVVQGAKENEKQSKTRTEMRMPGSTEKQGDDVDIDAT